MTRYTAAQARQRLAHLLDQAEKGEAVLIERRGVRFRVRAERPRAKRARRESIFEYIDPAVQSGQWTWDWGPSGLRFVDKRKKPR